MVQFLFTTCPHCQAYSQLLTKLQNEYGPKGFQALGGAFNEADNTMVTNYVNQYQVGFPVGVMLRDTVMNFMGFSVDGALGGAADRRDRPQGPDPRTDRMPIPPARLRYRMRST